MACIFDLIKSNVINLLKKDEIYFVVEYDLDNKMSVNCFCNACCCNIFFGITTENFSKFEEILQSHRKIHFANSSKLRKARWKLSITNYMPFSTYYRPCGKTFLSKLSYYFTTKHFKIIKTHLSVIFKECVVCVTCELCRKEFIMHFRSNLLTIFVDHFTKYHERLQKLLEALSTEEKLNSSCENQSRRDPSSELFKKLLIAQQSGILKPFLSYFKNNRELKLNENLFVKKSSLNLQDNNLYLLPYRTLVLIESILDFMSCVSIHLTDDQVYFIVNKRQSIDCVCNICFCRVFKSFTGENFQLFEKTLISHLFDVKHFCRLTKSIVDGNTTNDPISTNDVDFRHKFIDKISKYFTENNYLIKSNLDISQLRNNFVLISCDFCSKEFMMHVNCGLKTSFVAHLKDPVHKKVLKKIYGSVSKPKQSHQYRHQFDEKKFIEILRELERKTKKTVDYLYVELNETEDLKFYCALCRRKLPYDCEQSTKRIIKALENHIKNSVNHSVKNGFKKGKKSRCVKQRFQYPADFFLKDIVDKTKKCYSIHSKVQGDGDLSGALEKPNSQSQCNKLFSKSQLFSSTTSVLTGNHFKNEIQLLGETNLDKLENCYSKHQQVGGNIINIGHFGMKSSTSRLYQGNFSNRQLESCCLPAKSALKLNENRAQLLRKTKVDKVKKCFLKFSQFGRYGKYYTGRTRTIIIWSYSFENNLGPRNYIHYPMKANKEFANLQIFSQILNQNHYSFDMSKNTEKIGAKNHVRRQFDENRIILISEVDFKTRYQSSILESKKLQCKLQHQQSFFKYSFPFLNYKKQRTDDFITGIKVEAKRCLKNYQVSNQPKGCPKNLHGLRRHKQDVVATMNLESIRQQDVLGEVKGSIRRRVGRHKLARPFDTNEIKSRKLNFSAFVNLEISSTVTENIYCDFNMQKISKKTWQKQSSVRYNSAQIYINNCLNSCFQNWVLPENSFFRIIINNFGERCLVCTFCRYQLPFNCKLPLQYLCYLSISHVENCFNHLYKNYC